MESGNPGMRRSRVIIRKASYDYATLKPLIFEMADALRAEEPLVGKAIRKLKRL